MLGRVLVAIAGGIVMWRYRDTIREYVSGNSAPARETIDGLLRTVQDRSGVLFDQAKEQLSSRLESARERVRAGGPAGGSGNAR